MSAETKSEAFHRLATKRIETVTDAIRIFGNLSNPNYEWSNDEVLSYLTQIEMAVTEALDRFKLSKNWAHPEIEEHLEDVPEVPVHRRYTITEIIREAKDDREALAEMVAMQRVVIEDLKNNDAVHR